jgi:hypothetical protein
MRNPRQDDSAAFEEILDGRSPTGDRSLHGVAEFVRETRRVFTIPPADEARERHLAAMAAVVPVPGVRRHSARFAAKVAGVSAGVVLAAGSAMAATGTLPAAAQLQISKAAQHIGLHFPTGESPTSPNHPTTPAEGNKGRADAFTQAKQAWTRCVSAAAQLHRGPGGFEPETECGPKPTPEQAGPKDAVPPAEPGSSGTDSGQGTSHTEHAGQDGVHGSGQDNPSTSDSGSDHSSDSGLDHRSDSGSDQSSNSTDRGASSDHIGPGDN